MEEEKLHMINEYELDSNIKSIENLFNNTSVKDINNLKRLININKRKQKDIIKKLKECINEAI